MKLNREGTNCYARLGTPPFYSKYRSNLIVSAQIRPYHGFKLQLLLCNTRGLKVKTNLNSISRLHTPARSSRYILLSRIKNILTSLPNICICVQVYLYNVYVYVYTHTSVLLYMCMYVQFTQFRISLSFVPTKRTPREILLGEINIERHEFIITAGNFAQT